MIKLLKQDTEKIVTEMVTGNEKASGEAIYKGVEYMILADKIADLRKKNGWSQEEFANQLGVSRQAVSKWESASSIPDLNKIIKMSELFCVSTDYLLKDSMEGEMEKLPEVYEMTEKGKETFAAEEEKVHSISLEEANTYLDLVKNTAEKIAFGVMLCILSPVVLILLGGLSDKEGGYVISEALAVGTGMTVLLVLVAVAAAIFIFYGRKLETYDFLEKELIELEYGVTGMVEKQKIKYEGTHGRLLVLGVVLCILSAVPLMVLGAADEDGMAAVIGVDICLIFVAVGVFMIVKTCMLYGSFQRLLEEGDYRREKKLVHQRNDIINTVYWCMVTAIYLGWSFVTMEWHRTWIIWPVAGVFYGVVQALVSAFHRKS